MRFDKLYLQIVKFGINLHLLKDKYLKDVKKDGRSCSLSMKVLELHSNQITRDLKQRLDKESSSLS